MVERILKNYFEFICLSAISILFIVMAIGLPVGIESLNMIRVFNNDEARGVELLHRCLTYNNLDPNFYYYYGMCNYTICFGICKVIELFSHQHELSIFTIAYVLKLVSFFSFVFFAIVFYRLCRLFLSKEWSWLCLLAVSTITSFASLGHMIHPDMLMVALVVLSFNIVFKNHSVKGIYLAQFVAGLAFGTKYNALFVFPFLFLPHLFEKYFNLEKFSFTKKQILHVFVFGIKGSSFFLLGWIIFNPYSIINYKYFLDTLVLHSVNASSGFVELRTSKNPFEWFEVFRQQIPLATILLLSLSILLSFIFPWRKSLQISSGNSNLITLFCYSVFCFLYIFFFVRLRDMRYSFHFLPMLFVFLFFVLETTFQNLKTKLKFVFPVLLIASVATVFQTVKSFPTVTEKLNNPYLKSGKILGDNFSKETIIYCDFYSYVPDSFLTIYYDWFINKVSIAKINPDVVIINRRCSGKKAWMRDGTTISQKQWVTNSKSYPETIKKQLDFYDFLLNGNSAYEIFYEDEFIVIFSRKEK